MVHISKDSWKVMVWIGSCGTILLGYLIKISPIMGSSRSFLSLTDFIAPVTGLFGWSIIGIIAVARIVLFGGSVISFMTPVYHLPGICGALAWDRATVLMRVVIPIVCMILFSAHSIGRFAIPYTFYWFIPLILYALNRNSVFETALATTFVTHAVGSVIWLYVKNIPVAIWWALIPIVAYERLFSAVAMTISYYGIKQVIVVIRTYGKKKSLIFRN